MARNLAVVAVLAFVALYGGWATLTPNGKSDALDVAIVSGQHATLPEWIVLPETGRIITSGVYPPQPPYGAAASATLMIDETTEAFAAAYEARLTQADFVVRRLPARFNAAFDEPDLQFEADERRGGHVVYVAFRHTFAARFVQLTFWDPPAPKL